MTQLTIDFPKFKNGNGGKHGRPDERKLTADLRKWLGDLDAAECLKLDELKKIRKLRAEVYGLAKARGLTPAMLRAAHALLRK